jgi:hypothetical protein
MKCKVLPITALEAVFIGFPVVLFVSFHLNNVKLNADFVVI